MSIIARIRRALRIARQIRTVEAAYLAATNELECMTALASIGVEVADKLAERYAVRPGPTAYVTATRLVAAQFPGSNAARLVREQEAEYRRILGRWDLMTAVRY